MVGKYVIKEYKVGIHNQEKIKILKYTLIYIKSIPYKDKLFCKD